MPEQRIERKLVAILAADVAGYSRLVGLDEEGTLARLKTLRREVIDPEIASHRGRIVKTTGDGLLIEFASVVDAVRCAVAVQRACVERETALPQDRRIEFRVGINLGDIVVEGDDILGDGVNIAARLEGIAEPGGICISGVVFDQVRGKVEVEFVDLGEQSLKNIAQPVRAYRVLLDKTATAISLPPLPLPDKPSIAVLPFQNMSGDPEQEYFADGIVEDITTALSRVRSLFVIARNSSFTYKGRAVDVKQVGRELGVRYVLEGSVRKSTTHLRITSQLVDAHTGHHVWAERYDRELQDIFDIQDEITFSVTASVQTQVDLHEGDLARRAGSSDLNVWGLLKKAWGRFLDLNITAIQEARPLVEEALRLDPRNARAQALMSVIEYHLALMGRGLDAHEQVCRARERAIVAVKLDDKDEFAHWALGNARLWLAEDDYGISNYRRALELNPNFSLAYGLMGSALIDAGRAVEGIEATMTAIRSNPRDPSNFFRHSSLAVGYFALRDFDTAIEWARKSIDSKKGYYRPHLTLIASLANSGRIDEARLAVAAYLRDFPDGSVRDAAHRPFMKSVDYGEALLAGLRLAGLPE
jgi:adenylate cyclase